MAKNATIVVLDSTFSGNVGELFYTYLANVDSNASPSATSFTAINPVDQIEIDVQGTGFKFNLDGTPTAGTATHLLFRDVSGGSTDLVEADFNTGISMAALIPALEQFTNSGGTISTKLDAIFNPYAVDFTGSDGNEEFTTGTAADNLFGGDGADILDGTSGNDIIEGGKGADTLIGGLGIDTVSYESSASSVTIILGQQGTSNKDGSNKGDAVALGGTGDEAGDKLYGFENIVGSALTDALVGDGLANKIEGGDGNDSIEGEAGNDSLFGGDGNDTIDGGLGADLIDGGIGSDFVDYGQVAGMGVTVTLGKDGTATGLVTKGGATGDKLLNIEKIFGTLQNDTLTGNNLDNTLVGNSGDDVIQGGAGADSLSGNAHGANGDTLSYSLSAAGVTVSLSQQDGTTQQKGGDAEGDKLSGFEHLIGSAKNDVLTGHDTDVGVNRVDGGAGDDTIRVTMSGDRNFGGAGLDTLSFELFNTSVTADLNLQGKANATRTDITLGGGGNGNVGGGHSATEFENLTGGTNVDTLTGDKFNNVIDGGAGDDQVDTLDGGAGSDTISFASATSAVTFTLGALDTKTGEVAQSVASGGAGADLVKNFENILGSAFDDALNGNAGVNKIDGGDGNDTVFGEAGNDTIEGGEGNDVLWGDDLANSVTGNDIINGGDGDDEIYGGLGADKMDGGAGIDTLEYGATPQANLTVNLTTNKVTVTGPAAAQLEAKGDTIKNFENVEAGGGNDMLIGSAGANVLLGDTGDDTIQGMGGADDLQGGTEGANGDTLSYSLSKEGVTVSLDQQNGITQQKGGDAEGDVLSGFEHLIGSAKNDVLAGDDGNDLVGRVDGGAGDDTILAAPFASDQHFGGAGLDTLSFALAGSALTLDLALQGKANAARNAITGGGGNQGDIGNNHFATEIENLIGGTAADTLTGDKLSNVLEGGAGGDTLTGGLGVDTASYAGSASAVNVELGKQDGVTAQNAVYDFGSGNVANGDAAGDVLQGFEGVVGSAFGDFLFSVQNDAKIANTLSGGDGNDYLGAGMGKDKLLGGDGDDEAFLGLSKGGAFFDGGDGDDFASFNSGVETSGITITLGKDGTLTGFSASGGAATGLKLVNVENIGGTTKNDKLTGNNLDNAIDGGAAGDDLIQGMGGADTLDGGTHAAGGDTVSYALSGVGVTVNLDQQDGLTQQTGGDAQGDTLKNFEHLIGSGKNDVLTGNDSDDGINRLDGGAGDDLIVVATAVSGDQHFGGAGIDTLSFANIAGPITVDLANQGKANATRDNITGGGGSNGNIGGGHLATEIENLIGTASADTLTGDKLNNVIEGGAGGDILDGGAGTGDTLSYASSTGSVTVTLNGAANATVSGGHAAGDQAKNFENIIGSAKNDVLTGDALVNVIDGGAGNDRLVGSLGKDTLDGGDGIDRLDYSALANSSKSITVTLGEADKFTTVTGTAAEANGDKVANFENVNTDDGNDKITGNSLANDIRSAGGDDKIFGLGGDDFIISGPGADFIDGGTGFDNASYDGATVEVSIDLADGIVSFKASAVTDTLRAVEFVQGGTKDDTFDATGFSGSSTNAGSGGTFNQFEGMDGDDTITGNGNTRVSYQNANGGVNVTLGAGGSGGAGEITATDVGTDTFVSGVAHIRGSNSNDLLTGNSSDNRIEGRSGTDNMAGGGGNDQFEYTNAAHLTSNDNISDFNAGDRIRITKSGFGIDGSVTVGGAGANNFETEYFVAGAAATKAHGQFIWDTTIDLLYWDADGTGGGAAVQVAALTNGYELQGTDFNLV